MTRKQLLSGRIEDPLMKLNLKQLELNALLEVTEAINANLPEETLYKIYHFTLITNLHINRLALFVQDEVWECKAKYGCTERVKDACVSEEILQIDRTTDVCEHKGFEEFDILIPITHKGKKLAIVFLGGTQELDIEETDSIFSFVQTITSIIMVAIENKKMARRQLQQEALRKELEIASKVQNNLFPRKLPENNNISIKASYLPNLVVGGDYYDYIELGDNKFIFCIADVSGKGISAAILMSSFQSGLRTLVRRSHDLKDIVRELNVLVKNNAQGERFITFFAAIADLNTGKLNYINAGHNPPVLVYGGEYQLLETGTTVLGAFDNLPFVESAEVELKSGTVLFSYTDGLTEVSDEAGEEYGPERLIEFLVRDNMEYSKLHENLLSEITAFKGKTNFPDDITCFSCLFSEFYF